MVADCHGDPDRVPPPGVPCVEIQLQKLAKLRGRTSPLSGDTEAAFIGLREIIGLISDHRGWKSDSAAERLQR
jgi:hypothetical protein